MRLLSRVLFHSRLFAALLGWLALQSASCEVDRETCEAMDLSGQWAEVGGTGGTLRVSGTMSDLAVLWSRPAFFGGEEDTLRKLRWPPDKDKVLGDQEMANGDALGKADNIAPRTGQAHFYVRTDEDWPCLTFPLWECRLHYRLDLRGEAGGTVLRGNAEIWVREGPLFTGRHRKLETFDVTFERRVEMERVECDERGRVNEGQSSGGGCGGGSLGSGDAGSLFEDEDAGRTDAGSRFVDAGTRNPDASVPDAAAPADDAGATQDAGGVMDAGGVVDAGVVTDAGEALDAGSADASEAPDAAEVSDAAAVALEDAGGAPDATP